MKFCTDVRFYETLCLKINWNLEKTHLGTSVKNYFLEQPPCLFFLITPGRLAFYGVLLLMDLIVASCHVEQK